MFDTQQEALEGVDTTDTDGDGLYDTYEIAGMIIPNGRYIDSDPLDPDTDGDGLSDGEEMGELRALSEAELAIAIISALPSAIFDYFTDGELNVHFKCFDYKSNPNAADSDGDDAFDDVDAYPFVFNELKAYIFYPLTGEDFLIDEANDRYSNISKKMMVEKIGIDTKDDFVTLWNNMGYNSQGKLEWIISDVYTVFHGSPTHFGWSNTQNINESFGNDNLNDINGCQIDNKKIANLHLSSCNNGNLDWLNVLSGSSVIYDQNLAITFLKRIPGIESVYAWDGYSTYYTLFGNAVESAASYRNFWEYLGINKSSFDNWSLEKNGEIRSATGLIKYSRCNNAIVYSPNCKLFIYYDLQTITEVIQ